ncbi:hypothetical protein [[Clostridium] polysaccharolyticum]|uniref:GNAT family acetyltransferase n=1 Tax=[Clostridium] polysaccharolyticum TaxID=29364 RepID=A0A1I0B0I5_9FIRM|nr:hypothetical protein [[Clostridium] polysaccharolyticum]SET00208.1 hypothetical protein SAMN04487772_106124 [[Clostridium] polysaccharolyticum]
MITDHNLPLNYIKKENLTGSYQGMRFMFTKEEEGLLVYIWPEPYCFEKTEDAKKTAKLFDFSEEGKLAAIDWMNEQYQARKSEWQSAVDY